LSSNARSTGLSSAAASAAATAGCASARGASAASARKGSVSARPARDENASPTTCTPRGPAQPPAYKACVQRLEKRTAAGKGGCGPHPVHDEKVVRRHHVAHLPAPRDHLMSNVDAPRARR
jgi:hypothetical protein